MSFQPNIPPSIKAKMSAADDDLNNKKLDHKKLKELEENRKNALIPAMKDENGVDINPHIPEYMMKAPWYTGATGPTLSHQRAPEDKIEKQMPLDEQYIRGTKKGTGAAKFRNGACENCGAMGHGKKSCLERMKTRKAKYTNICAPDDRKQPDLKFSYDAKRDRWMGYNVENHKEVELKHKMVDEQRRQKKAESLESTLLEGENKDDDDDVEFNNDDIPIPVQNFDRKEKYHTKQLRIREDMPKYLYNLDPNSAYYDPKSRSMRENPFEGKDPQTVPYAGDNMVRWSGDVKDAYDKEVFASGCYSNGVDLNAFADPTRVELIHKQHKQEKVKQNTEITKSLIEAYGGGEHFGGLSEDLLMGQSEEYVEYTRRGVQIKGNAKRIIRSKYEEDVLERNHAAVWGSYWEGSKWGFKCCHSTFRNSYCIGKVGFKNELQSQEESVKEDNQTIHQTNMIDIQSNSLSQQPAATDPEGERQESEERRRKRNHKRRRHSSDSSSESSSSDDDEEPRHKKSRKSDSKKKSKKHKRRSDDSEDRKKELKKAIKKEKERLRQVEENTKRGTRHQAYNVTYDSKEPSELEIEAYQILKKRDGDPMP